MTPTCRDCLRSFSDLAATYHTLRVLFALVDGGALCRGCIAAYLDTVPLLSMDELIRRLRGEGP